MINWTRNPRSRVIYCWLPCLSWRSSPKSRTTTKQSAVSPLMMRCLSRFSNWRTWTFKVSLFLSFFFIYRIGTEVLGIISLGLWSISLSRVNCITAPNTMVGCVTHVVIFSILSWKNRGNLKYERLNRTYTLYPCNTTAHSYCVATFKLGLTFSNPLTTDCR